MSKVGQGGSFAGVAWMSIGSRCGLRRLDSRETLAT